MQDQVYAVDDHLQELREDEDVDQQMDLRDLEDVEHQVVDQELDQGLQREIQVVEADRVVES